MPTPPRLWTERPNENFARATMRHLMALPHFERTTPEDLDRLAAGEDPRAVFAADLSGGR